MRTVRWTVGALALGMLATAHAAGPKPEDAVDYRQGMMLGLGWNVGAMGAMVKGTAPWDAKRFALLASRTAALAPMAREGFTPETAKVKSKVKPALWQNLADFDQRTETLIKATVKLDEVAKGGDEAAIKAQFSETVKACKGCHEKYQERD